MHETGMWFFREIPSVYRKESIVVNDRMETSVPNIYAAGDAVQVKHYVTGNDALIPLVDLPINREGSLLIIFVVVIVITWAVREAPLSKCLI